MSYKLIIPRAISLALGRCGLSRHALLWTLNNLYERLESEAESFRGVRAAGAEEDCFVYALQVRDAGLQHGLTFRVNDRMAPGHLFLEAMAHRSRPAG